MRNTRKVIVENDTHETVMKDQTYFHEYFAALALLRNAIETNNEELRLYALQCKIQFDCHDTLNDYLLEVHGQQINIDCLSVRQVDTLILDVFEDALLINCKTVVIFDKHTD